MRRFQKAMSTHPGKKGVNLCFVDALLNIVKEDSEYVKEDGEVNISKLERLLNLDRRARHDKFSGMRSFSVNDYLILTETFHKRLVDFRPPFPDQCRYFLASYIDAQPDCRTVTITASFLLELDMTTDGGEYHALEHDNEAVQEALATVAASMNLTQDDIWSTAIETYDRVIANMPNTTKVKVQHG